MEQFTLPVYAFFAVALIQFVYWLIVFTRFAFKKPHVTQRADLLPPVSVIVVGRNEEENFRQNLPGILLQDYPQFEVIAVNDQSIDGSEEVLEELEKQHAHMRLVRVPENDQFWHGKKYGLTLGIKAAQYEHLLLTDADCMPHSPEWIREMISGFAGGKEVVLGFGNLRQQPGWVNRLSRFETVLTGLQYFSWAMWGMPYMGVGRNLAYRKSLWFQHNGFIKHIHLPGGDDDLFVNSAATRKNVAVVAKSDAHTDSDSKTTWAEWFRQKRRHFSTSAYYKWHHKFILGTFGATTFLFWPMAILAALTASELGLYIVAGVAGFRLITQWTVAGLASRFLKNRDIILLWPIMEVIWVVLSIYIQVSSWVGVKQKRWK